jgi:hypothetical protein
MNQKVKQQIPEVFIAFTHTKKVKLGDLLKSGSGSGLRRPVPVQYSENICSISNTATLLLCPLHQNLRKN